MGLPVWRAPSPDATRASKPDLTAPARSPIRRRSPAVAGRRARPARGAPSSRPFDTANFLASASPRHANANANANPEPAARTSTGSGNGSGSVRLPPPPVPESRNYRYASWGDSLQDYVNWDSQRSLFVPSPRVAEYTPNFAPAAASRTARAERPATSARLPASSRRSRLFSEYPGLSADPPRRLRRSSTVRDYTVTIEDSDDDSNNNAVGLPPLRRMGRRTIADGPLPSSSLRESWSPATTVDGLGDRERSMSPVDDDWDTMLNTVAPDPLAPTADSSFTSAAASASFSNSHVSSRAGSSNSNSASSSRTHLTVPSRRPSPPNDQFIRACDTSDSDSASDTEEEDMDYLNFFHRPSQQESRPRAPLRGIRDRGVRDRERGFSDTRMSDLAVNELTSLYFPSQRRRPSNDQLDGPAEEPSSIEDELQTLDQELREARAILERLSQRGDVSDEFWASVGLSRPMSDRVERIQQRDRL